MAKNGEITLLIVYLIVLLGIKKIILFLNLTRSQGCPNDARAVSLAKNKSTQHGNVKFVGQSVSHVR